VKVDTIYWEGKIHAVWVSVWIHRDQQQKRGLTKEEMDRLTAMKTGQKGKESLCPPAAAAADDDDNNNNDDDNNDNDVDNDDR